MVMTMSVIRGRAENAQVPDALAYYRRLERESDLVYHASPYKPGRAPVPLHFDFSYNYYPTAYQRPGPDVTSTACATAPSSTAACALPGGRRRPRQGRRDELPALARYAPAAWRRVIRSILQGPAEPCGRLSDTV